LSRHEGCGRWPNFLADASKSWRSFNRLIGRVRELLENQALSGAEGAIWPPGAHVSRAPMSHQKVRAAGWTFLGIVDAALQRLAPKLLGKKWPDVAGYVCR
jgi:hypothetical protein